MRVTLVAVESCGSGGCAAWLTPAQAVEVAAYGESGSRVPGISD